MMIAGALALMATLHGAPLLCEVARDETPDMRAPCSEYEGEPRNRHERRAARKAAR